MNSKKNNSPKLCIFSKRPINSFGGKRDREKSGIHTSFGPVHKESYSEYESLISSIRRCVCDELKIHPSYSPISHGVNKLISKIGKICASEGVDPEEVIPRFRDKINHLNQKLILA